jgi:3-oxoacyl-[acyl-carrier-protein] synthase III
MILARVAGTGRCVPERVVTNEDLSRIVETSDEWIRTRTGIGQRHLVSEGEATSDLAAEAGRRALASAGIGAGDIDLVLVATVTADMPMPSCAMMVQQKIGARCPAFDVGAACAGFSYGLTVADGLIRSGVYRRVLFVGAEALSCYMDWTDRTTCVLFGDGAGAVVLTGEEQDVTRESPEARGILATSLGADGSQWKELNIMGGGSLHPPSAETLAAGLHHMRMNGRAIFSSAVRLMSEACEEVLAAVGMTARDVDLVVPHQANLRIIEAIMRRLDVSPDRVLVNIERYGNTSSASIPIALDEAARGGRLQDGMSVLCTGLGAGLAWGAALIRW